jgi:quercetin dioxygenase-like cupin family protein
MRAYPYSIENGHGETMTFFGLSKDGDRVEAEARAQPGAGPPMHVHHLQEEAMQVVSGRLGYQVLGEEPKFAGPGDLAIFAPGVAHKWWNAGSDELRATGWAKPPDNIEFFLGAIFASVKATGKGRPSLFDAAFLMTRYRSEFGMLEIPALVQRAVFPLLVIVGRLLDKYRKFTDAPEPISAGRRPRHSP